MIKTTRLYLDEMQQSDYTALCKILKDPEVMYAYEGPFSDQEVQNWFDKQRSNYEKYGFGLWAVRLHTTGEMIGQCGLTMQSYEDNEILEVGYLFQKAFWHKGYAAEAAIACRDYAFEALHAEQVYSIIRDTNIASQNVAKRNGMKKIASFVKHYRGVHMPHYLYEVKKREHVCTG